MTVSSMLDSAGRRRSPATLPGFYAGRAPRNKGMLYPADPPTVEEIVCVMRHASDDPHGFRLRAMIVMLWRGGLRIQEALALWASGFQGWSPAVADIIGARRECMVEMISSMSIPCR